MKFKKLIHALCMLLVAAVLMGTSTFAWFSMNREVTATGMQITAKSDSVFLLIGSGDADTASEIQTAGTITTALTVDANAAQVYPSAHDTITNTATATATDVSNLHHYVDGSSNTITVDAYNALDASEKSNYTAVNQPGTNWYYRIADAVNASASTKQYNYLATVDSAYVIHKTCYITLAAGSNDAANLKVSNMAIASNNTATGTGNDVTFAPVKVLITTATAQVELDSSTTSSNTVLASTVTDDAVVQVDIFIYYNGNDTNVFTNNVANLDGATIDLTFSVD